METKPVSVEVGSTETSDDSKSAIDLLYELAEKQRRLSPELTIQQAFARVYENPEYSKLAQAERCSNRPNASSLRVTNCSEDDFTNSRRPWLWQRRERLAAVCSPVQTCRQPDIEKDGGLGAHGPPPEGVHISGAR